MTATESKYDFLGQSYANLYPNLHKYPATMLPQIGLELLKEFRAKKTNLLDPYCGSGSSFASGLEYGIKNFIGFDLNPLAIYISKAKLTFIESNEIQKKKEWLIKSILQGNFSQEYEKFNNLSNITNLDFWIQKDAQGDLLFIFSLLCQIQNSAIKNLFILAFSETLRESSYTRNNEFKLFRMKEYENFKPNVKNMFIQKLDSVIQNYLTFYQPKIREVYFAILNQNFKNQNIKFDTILTSPPYGDSKTTVAYGQFSTFINEWLGFKEARKLDSNLLGGKKAQKIYNKGIITDSILEIEKIDKRRALEVSSFYFDLEISIKSMLDSINTNGLVFFIVGNRKVKNIELPTDEFIAEIFSNHNFKHLKTIKRKISNKAMPILNSPSNKKGKLSNTMNDEHIVICQKESSTNHKN